MTAPAITNEKRAELLRAARGERRPADAAAPMGIQVRTVAPAADVTAPTPVTEAVEAEPLTVEEVLHLAQGSESTRTRSLGERIAAALADLTQRVQVETAEADARAAAEQARKELAEQEAALAQQLAAVRQQLRGSRRSGGDYRASTTVDVDPQVVRAWAAEAKVECNVRGRVPQRVVDAWRAATGSGVSG